MRAADVLGDRQVPATLADVIECGDSREALLIGERSVPIDNPGDVFFGEEALRSLARDLIDSVDQEHLAPALGRLSATGDDDARLHRRVVEKVGAEPNHSLERVVLEQLVPHVALLVAKEHAVREQNCAAPADRIA